VDYDHNHPESLLSLTILIMWFHSLDVEIFILISELTHSIEQKTS
jgi:hypothetical protein